MAQYVFGLDIGIASVGWAVLDEQRVVDLGVRCFDKAETAKEGDPLNLTRRQARLLRRRLYRRAWRLTQLARLLKREGLIENARLFAQSPAFTEPDPTDPTGKRQQMVSAWELRRQGLDRPLSPLEWARVIYHLCKHRGFHWTSKAEEAKADSDAEGGRVKQGLKNTAARMAEKGYRSAAEMVLAEFPEQRNKRGQYDKALSRVLLGEEMALLFATQRRLGNPHVSERFEALILGSGDRRSGLFWQQKPALSGADLLKMLGKCTFEKGEYRAAKASFSAERHVWLTRLNNLRIVVDGRSRPLNDAERQAALLLPYQTEAFKYKALKNALVKAGLWSDDLRFGGLAYPSRAQTEADKIKDPEDQTLVKLPAWHELRKAFKAAGQEALWQRISTPALDGTPDLLDQITTVLSVYKDGAEVEQQLRQLSLPEPDACIAVLEKISFDKFSSLSLKALQRIVPLMQTGLRYDEAVTQISEYGHHSQRVNPDTAKRLYLPPFYKPQRKYNGKNDRVGSMQFREDANIPRNPVVLRALNQARKVVNALIREYGSPVAVHIEMARDLSRPLDERNKVKKAQEEFRDRNEKARTEFERDFGYKPKAAAFEKWMLYREQLGQCAYSQQPLDIQRVLDDPNYAQVDHALPYSRSYDDSKNNKVLVLTRENQNKGNRTAYEYLIALDGGQEGERWRTFAAWVQGNKTYRMAKRNRLLRKNYGREESSGFIDRNLNDTRYICKFFKNYVEEHLQLAERADGQMNRRCVVVNGQLTAFLRARWGLTKVRSESDRHHALDAAVVAACTHAMVKALADYARRKELELLQEGFPDPETGEILNPAAFDRARQHFPEPWPHFRHELQARLFTNDLAALREDMQRLGTYGEEELKQLHTLFVSRAPQRRNGGAVHKETIYAQPESLKAQGGVIEKVLLTSLKLQDLDNLVEPHRNERLYAAIRKRLEDHGGKADKAFGPSNPLHKPDKSGQPTGPVVRSVKLVRNKQSGIPIRGGLAKNDSMLRVDVFTKAGKFHLVPVYVHHRVTGLPNRAIVAFKDEDEWTLIDESFQFLFSIHPNDLIRITLKKHSYIGYFASCHRGTGAFNLWSQDRNAQIGKGGAVEGIGIKTALSLEKFNVDVLGHIYPAPPEVRHGLA
jgi:CRISPR-associated endonuclease Csn1